MSKGKHGNKEAKKPKQVAAAAKPGLPGAAAPVRPGAPRPAPSKK